jgi:hypothetical protein
MRLYGIDYGTTPPRPVLWLHAEIDQARRWLQEGPKRRLVEVPGKPKHLCPVTRAERFGRVLGASPKRVGHPPHIRCGEPAMSARQPAPPLIAVLECGDEGGCHSRGVR